MKVAGEARDPIISGGLLDLVEGYSTDGILGFRQRSRLFYGSP